MKKVVIAVGIILAIVVLYVGSYYGTRAFSTPKDSQLIDQIITLQEKQQEILTTAQRNLADGLSGVFEFLEYPGSAGDSGYNSYRKRRIPRK